MVSNDAFRELALSFMNVSEEPHFQKTSFRVKKKIFATLDEKERRAVLKFNAVDQSVYCDSSKGTITIVPGSWGKRGYTYVDLRKVTLKLLKDAVSTSYAEVAIKKKPGK